MSRSPAAIDADLSRATAELAELIRQRGELSARIEAAEARVRALTVEGRGLLARAQAGNNDDVVTSANVRVSLRAIAEAVGVSHSLLSQAHHGKRRIKRSLAEKIARLTKAMPANRTTWPLGWVDE